METLVVGVTDRTNWVFALVALSDGTVGVGEATLDGCEEMVEIRINQLQKILKGRSIESPEDLVNLIGIEDTPLGLINAAAVSAIEQALWDAQGRRLGQPISAILTSNTPAPVRAYANINRALLQDRSPETFAQIAVDAVSAGFRSIKCAPFDEVYRANLSDPDTRRKVDLGLARIAAVRSSVGPDVQLMVDCHYRFTADSAPLLMKRIDEFDPYWIEAPVPEHRTGDWAEIHRRYKGRIAGGEMMAGRDRFKRFIVESHVDVVMPDVKYVGGISGLLTIADMAARQGIAVAPHNPSGPISTLATVHASSAIENLLTIEYAFGECDWRSSLVAGAEVLKEGKLVVPDRPGLGSQLALSIARAHPRRAVQGLDTRLYG